MHLLWLYKLNLLLKGLSDSSGTLWLSNCLGLSEGGCHSLSKHRLVGIGTGSRNVTYCGIGSGIGGEKLLLCSATYQF